MAHNQSHEKVLIRWPTPNGERTAFFSNWDLTTLQSLTSWDPLKNWHFFTTILLSRADWLSANINLYLFGLPHHDRMQVFKQIRAVIHWLADHARSACTWRRWCRYRRRHSTSPPRIGAYSYTSAPSCRYFGVFNGLERSCCTGRNATAADLSVLVEKSLPLDVTDTSAGLRSQLQWPRLLSSTWGIPPPGSVIQSIQDPAVMRATQKSMIFNTACYRSLLYFSRPYINLFLGDFQG